MSKAKILVAGSVQGNAEVFVNKIKSLQSSKAGPFDVCFCVGPWLTPEQSKEGNHEELLKQVKDLPLPVYLQQYPGFEHTNDVDNESEDTESRVPKKLAENLFLLGNANDSVAKLWEIEMPNREHPLMAVSCPPHFRMDGDYVKSLQKEISEEDYQGCDFLFTSDWPQGMEDIVNADALKSSFDTAEIALQCKPRYHVSFSSGFHQSPAYRVPGSPYLGRFLSMGPVIPGKPGKTKKYIHALGIEPIKSDPAPPAPDVPTLPCPYLPSVDNGNDNSSSLPAFAQMSGPSSFSRFHTKLNGKRGREDKGKDGKENDKNSFEPPNDTISTLFLHGLHRDVSGELQSTQSPILFESFRKYGVKQVRHPPAAKTTTFCFLEFDDQQAAMSCLMDCQGEITLKGVPLALRWGTGNKRQRKDTQMQNRHFVTQEEAATSTTLYFQPPADVILLDEDDEVKVEGNDEADKESEEKGEGEGDDDKEKEAAEKADEKDENAKGEEEKDEGKEKADESSEEKKDDAEESADGPAEKKAPKSKFGETLRLFMETTLEHAINEGVDDPADRVTVESEPALKVGIRVKEKYGFLEFASHAAATMSLAALTTSTDGGTLVPPPPGKEGEGEPPRPPPEVVGTQLRWAKGEEKSAKKRETNYMEALGLRRKHFPKDARTDCWFCLASSTCEKHLITGVYETCYSTMPKGPAHPGHVLLVPVAHSSQGALTMGSNGGTEIVSVKQQIQKHASEVYDMDLFVFERAIETKGGYHTHIQCIPIPRGIALNLQKVMVAHAQASGFELRPIQSDLGITAMLSEEDNYFYAEIATNSQVHRFLYKSDGEDNVGRRPKVPLQFGREVLASVLKKPELAHWKSCVVDEDKEKELATSVRESLEEYTN